MVDKTEKAQVKRASRSAAKVEVVERDEASEAFDELRSSVERLGNDRAAEMTIIRRSLEKALDRFESIEPPRDYSDLLTDLARQSEAVAARMTAFEGLPMLSMPPDRFAEMTGKAVNGALTKGTDPIIAKLRSVSGEYAQLQSLIQQSVNGARERRRQNIILIGVFAGGIVLGMLLWLLMVRVSGEASNGVLTAAFMGKSPWEAGQTIMQTANPAHWQRLMAAETVLRNNGDTLTKCQAIAAKTSRDQKCYVTVRPPDH